MLLSGVDENKTERKIGMIYITGDTHGIYERFEDPRLKALKHGDTLIICGDFGFVWDGSKQESLVLKKLSKKKYNICFVDGTHENFELLEEYEEKKWNGGKVHQLAVNIFHLMRGQIYQLEDQTIFTMGGGESPDIDIRFEQSNWQNREKPTRDELVEGVDNLARMDGKVDIIVTHEPPAKLKDFLLLRQEHPAAITGINSFFEQLSDTCEYSRWFFGSLHIDKIISANHISLFSNIVDAKTGEPVRKSK